jgi:hypothetical protein
MPERNESLEALRADVKKQATAQVAKWLIGAAVAGVALAATGWWLYLKPKLIEVAGGVPSGVVAAFDGPDGCPAGWSNFEDAAGRVLVGSGKGDGLTERRYRDQGGAETRTLTIQEIPPHTHEVVQMVYDNNVDGVDSTVTHSGEHHNEPRPSGAAGEGRSFSTMPPYLALKYCKKR